MPPQQLRQRLADGRYVCPHCLASGVQPGWARVGAEQETLADHLRAGHGWDEERVRAVGEDLVDHHAELHDPRNRDVLAPPRHSHGARRASIQTTAHESQDDSILSHCPWDGSGQITGAPDGTVTCGFCGRSFTVRLQPTFPAVPQVDPTTGMPLGDAPAGPGGGDPAGMVPQAPPPPQGAPGLPQAPAGTTDPRLGGLGLRAVRRLALRCSTDPAATLAQILGEGR